MGYRHKRRTVERTTKQWLQRVTNQGNEQTHIEYSTSRSSQTIISNDDPQNNSSCSSTDQENNNLCYSPTQNDQNLNDADDIGLATNPDDESVNDLESANDSESTTNVARIEECVDGRLGSEGLQFSQTDTAMLSVYDLASQRGVSITFIEELFQLLRRMDADKSGIEISKTGTRKTLMKRLKEFPPKKNPVPAIVQVPSTNIPVL